MFRGDLTQTPLPEVLLTIHRYRAPGVVECERDGVTKQIFIDDGNIIFALSSDLAESLGDFLLQSGKITQEQYDGSVQRLKLEPTRRQGAILVEMGALEPKELFVAVVEQVQSIVWSVFAWETGFVRFEPGRERNLEFIKLNIPTPQAVLEGIRRQPDAKPFLARIGTRTTILCRNEDDELPKVELTEAEQKLLAEVDGKKSLMELIALPFQTGAENARVLYALFALRIIVVKANKPLKVQLRVGKAGSS